MTASESKTIPHLQLSKRDLSALVIEDTATCQMVAVKNLERWGFRVRVSAGGDEALAILTSEFFDLVLMDIRLPGIDGLELCRVLRLYEQSANVERPTPIIAVSASVRPEDRELCRGCGMDRFLAKPYTGKALLDAIRDVLEVSQRWRSSSSN